MVKAGLLLKDEPTAPYRFKLALGLLGGTGTTDSDRGEQ
jgi:hypothetical protein